MKQQKYDRRRAVNCKLIRKSKSNPGYCKYLVTIAEKDGTYHKEPAYGRDMQDAISRLMWKERTYKVEKKIDSTWVALIAVGLFMGYPAFLADSENQPLYLLLSLVGITLLFGGVFVWYKYIEKANE
jgi:hypothetical protein